PILSLFPYTTLFRSEVPGAPVDRRADLRVPELEPGVVHVGLRRPLRGLRVLDRRAVGLHGRLHRRQVRLELIILLTCDELFLDQRLVAALLDPRVRELGRVALEVRDRLLNLGLALEQRRLRLAERGLERARIDGEEEVVLANVLAFLEVHLDDLPVDL